MWKLLTLTFGVEDIEFTKAKLEASNVEFLGDIIVVEKVVKLVSFLDLDGNKIMLYQDLADIRK